MQSEEFQHITGVDSSAARRYGIFQLAALLGEPEWRNSLSLAFPPSDVAALEGPAITSACIGLLGMSGALPYHYTEAVARSGGHGARAFMDMLSAPAIGAFNTAWRQSRPEFTVLPELPAHRGAPRARALGERLAQVLGVSFRVEQFAGCWEHLPDAQCSPLGSVNACCGGGALLGGRLWRCDGAVRVHVGPLGRDRAREFLPGASGALSLARHWRADAGAAGGLAAVAHIHLQPEAIHGVTLGGSGASVRLGYDAVLCEAVSGERDDLRYRLC